MLIGDNQSIVSQWREVIEKQLISMTENKNKMYACLTSYDLVGIATFVFVSGIYYNRVVKQEWLEIKTGFKSTMGNKGAIILFLQIDSTWLTFINCHLAAGETSQAERAQNIEYIHQDAISTRRQRRQF